MATASSVDSNDSAGPSRPSARPSSRPSRHHLEPNPFEQSFSSKPSDSASPESIRSNKGDKKSKGKPKRTEADIKEEVEGEQDSNLKAGDESNRANAPITPSATHSTPSKRILPPVSSIASPAPNETSNSMQYPWASSLTGSLRAGPLSPAMLAGPQSAFDVSSFRSGFTPDLSNFKTGLTPLGSSNSFPPPSPNTAAFLAMVTHASGANITPNTLSALSGNPMDSHINGSASHLSSQSGNNGDMKAHSQNHGEHHDQFDYAFGRSMQETPTKTHAASKLRMSTGGAEDRSESPDMTQQKQQEMKVQGVGGNRQHATQAASGLFLLSQAHQELSKREDAAAAAAAAAAAQGHEGGKNGINGPPRSANGKHPKGSATNKRKKSAEPTTAAGAPASKNTGNKKIKASKIEEMPNTEEEPGYESDELDEDGNRRVKSSNGEGGDDEEKRKNFLERNRQAALKCRQRKKAWLASLQAKVEYLQSDNENLQGTVGALRNEVMFLKSQLMQSQRQLGGGGVGGGNSHGIEGGQSPTMARISISGQGSLQGGMTQIMPSQSQQHQQNNINAMAAAAAAAAAAASGNINNGNINHNRMSSTSSQYQAHAVPRPTHIPGQANNNNGNQQYASPNVHKNHVRQESAQAA